MLSAATIPAPAATARRGALALTWTDGTQAPNYQNSIGGPDALAGFGDGPGGFVAEVPGVALEVNRPETLAGFGDDPVGIVAEVPGVSPEVDRPETLADFGDDPAGFAADVPGVIPEVDRPETLADFGDGPVGFVAEVLGVTPEVDRPETLADFGDGPVGFVADVRGVALEGDCPERLADFGDDPVGFAAEVLGVDLWEKQEEVLRALARSARVAVKSGNGLGKDFTAAVAILWFLHTRRPAIVISTAPTFRQVRNILWRQIHALHRRAADALGGELLDTRWELDDDRYALGLSAVGADQFQGFHCENILVVVDEAEGVSDAIYEGIESVMTTGNARLLLIGNPTTTSGGFHRAFHREAGIYETVTISALESPNVAAGRIVIPGLTSAAWVEERRRVWGADSDLFRARILGCFPERGENNLLAPADIDAAIYDADELSADGFPYGEPGTAFGDGDDDDADDDIIAELIPYSYRAGGPLVMGVDVARLGPDRSVVVARRGDVVRYIRPFPRQDTMAFSGDLLKAVRRMQPERVYVDVVGIGGGVYDRLREQGIRALPFNGGTAPLRETVCANRRAEGYWALAQRFRTRRIRIPRDTELLAELSELRYRYNSQGRLLLESKDELRARGLPSPDRADALMMAFLEDDGDAEPVDRLLGLQ